MAAKMGQKSRLKQRSCTGKRTITQSHTEQGGGDLLVRHWVRVSGGDNAAVGPFGAGRCVLCPVPDANVRVRVSVQPDRVPGDTDCADAGADVRCPAGGHGHDGPEGGHDSAVVCVLQQTVHHPVSGGFGKGKNKTGAEENANSVCFFFILGISGPG